MSDELTFEGCGGKGLSNEEAAKILEREWSAFAYEADLPSVPQEELAEAYTRGAAALRAIGRLEKENERLRKRWTDYECLPLHSWPAKYRTIIDEINRLEGK